MILRTASCISSTPRWPKWPAGRLILLPCHLADGREDEPRHHRKVLYAMAEELQPEDVVAVDLFRDMRRMAYGEAWVEPAPGFADTLALVKEIGPHIRGVMSGNTFGVELSYRYLYNTWRGDARGNIMACANYVNNVGGMLRDLSVAPFFAPMDLDILQDAYLCDWKLHAALNRVGATSYVACAYTMIPGAYSKADPQITGEVMEAHHRFGGGDFGPLQQYLASGQFWSGLCGLDGICAGNVEVLSSWGFKGFATKLQDEWLPEIATGRGDRWML